MVDQDLSSLARQRLQAVIDRWGCHTDLLSVPVPIERIARNEGWRILWGELFPVYGYAVVLGTIRIMRIDERIAPRWARFTIAHEMGHAIAGHRHGVRLGVSASGIEAPDEREASLIGLSLLVPEFMRGRSVSDVVSVCNVPARIVQSLGADIGIGIGEPRANDTILQPGDVRAIRRRQNGTRRLAPS